MPEAFWGVDGVSNKVQERLNINLIPLSLILSRVLVVRSSFITLQGPALVSGGCLLCLR